MFLKSDWQEKGQGGWRKPCNQPSEGENGKTDNQLEERDKRRGREDQERGIGIFCESPSLPYRYTFDIKH